MIATASFTIHVFVTFSDCQEQRQPNCRTKWCKV